MTDNRIERVYWQALSRYERRLAVYDEACRVLAQPEEDVPVALALAAMYYRNEYRPLVRQAITLAGILEERLFDGV